MANLTDKKIRNSSHNETNFPANLTESNLQQLSRKQSDNPIDMKPMKDRAVHFSVFSKLVFVDRPTIDEIRTKWYSREEYMKFSLALRADIQRMAQYFMVTPTTSVTPDMLCRCVGIENMLSRGVSERIVENKQSHFAVVMEEQHKQSLLNIFDNEEISRVSECHSMLSRMRAEKIAARRLGV